MNETSCSSLGGAVRNQIQHLGSEFDHRVRTGCTGPNPKAHSRNGSSAAKLFRYEEFLGVAEQALSSCETKMTTVGGAEAMQAIRADHLGMASKDTNLERFAQITAAVSRAGWVRLHPTVAHEFKSVLDAIQKNPALGLLFFYVSSELYGKTMLPYLCEMALRFGIPYDAPYFASNMDSNYVAAYMLEGFVAECSAGPNRATLAEVTDFIAQVVTGLEKVLCTAAHPRYVAPGYRAETPVAAEAAYATA